MTLRNFTAVLVVFATATLWGQNTAGPLANRRQPVTATSNAEGIAAANRARAVANQNLQEMGNTLTKMHALLKQMNAKTSAKDSMAKTNLDMWTLMVEQLDKQYDQLRLAARQREDFEARRAALYKQADEKAAQAARKAQAATSTDSNATQTPAAPGAAQTTTTSQPSATSPN